MKRVLVASIAATLIFCSCNSRAKQETVDKMADEMCKAMELWDKSDPMSILEVTSAMTEVQEKTEEYAKVTEDQLFETMKNKCPKGAEKLKELYEK